MPSPPKVAAHLLNRVTMLCSARMCHLPSWLASDVDLMAATTSHACMANTWSAPIL
jgi:hypothetical protein